MNENQILQAILDGQQLQDQTTQGYQDVTNSFVFKLLSNGGGRFIRMKPPMVPDIQVALFLKLGNNAMDLEYCADAVSNFPDMVCVLSGDTKEFKYVRTVGLPDPVVMQKCLQKLLILNSAESHMQRVADIQKALSPCGDEFQNNQVF